MTPEIFLILFLLFCMAWLLIGYPVAFVLGGSAIIFGFVGDLAGSFDSTLFNAIPSRIYGIMTNELLLAIPLFIFMGIILEKAKIAEELLINLSKLFSRVRGGLAISTIVVGALLAASTGIVGATVVTMGLISLPVMLNNNYSKTISTGVICASGTLGQIIPPSIVLLLLSDQISNAFKNTQMSIGNFSSEPVSVTDVFMAAIVPGVILVLSYIAWVLIYGLMKPNSVPRATKIKDDISFAASVKSALPPLLLMFVVLGSILSGVATATESSSIGAIGAMLIAFLKGRLTKKVISDTCKETAKVSSMIFTILIGATIFSLTFRGFGGDEIIHEFFKTLPGGLPMAVLFCMVFIFILGFFLDFIEITFIVIPIIVPPLILLGADPIWIAIMVAINLQTSFLTPPFGFSLFYLRGVADKSIKTIQIYKGIIPFVLIQLALLFAIYAFPQIALKLPSKFGYKPFIKAEQDSSTFNTDYEEIDF